VGGEKGGEKEIFFDLLNPIAFKWQLGTCLSLSGTDLSSLFDVGEVHLCRFRAVGF
jgi:hypothetical protein